ncbi:MAG: class I SAM-dependent methyltransferase [Actinomycetota bacterium]|nr:class I SAM-dependent methyltransferase [Actinomycetota bacterium]
MTTPDVEVPVAQSRLQSATAPILTGVKARVPAPVKARLRSGLRAVVPPARAPRFEELLEAQLASPESRAALIERLARDMPFEQWEAAGWHLTPNHFYSPIPDVSQLPDALWETESELPGIDMRDAEQLRLLGELSANFGDEFNALPRSAAGPLEYFVDNQAFESVDGEMLYALIRKYKPSRVLEVGSGWSTLCSLAALRRNAAEGAPGEVFAIEPYPYDFVRQLADDPLVHLRVEQLQTFPLSTFEQLQPNDILFIDSSHVLRTGSDVQYEFLEVLPRVPSGVLIHVHDIFLPGEYPRSWVTEEHRFWNEQYLLQAFLIGNRDVEVLWSSSYMHRRHPDELRSAVASYDPATRFPGSFWLRRV